MKRPHIQFHRPPSSGTHGLRRSGAVAAHQRIRAFLERATDCAGPHSVWLSSPRDLTEAQRALFPPGSWRDGQDLTWEGGRRERPGDPQRAMSFDALHHFIAGAPTFRAVVLYQFLLRDPRSGAALPYDEADFVDYPAPWCDVMWHAEEGAPNSVSLQLYFPFDEVNDTIVAIHDAVVDAMGIELTPKYWLRHTPSKKAGKYGTRKSIGFDRKAWVAAAPADEETFLAQIVADPDDDGLRQVYADLLIARGDPRGELINVQCQLARLAADAPERKKLAAAESKLLKAHGKAWARVPKVKKATLRRGFVEAIEVESTWDLEEEIVEVAPLVSDLAIRRTFEDRDLRRLVDWPGVGRLRRLAVRCRDDAAAARMRKILERATPLSALRELVVTVTA